MTPRKETNKLIAGAKINSPVRKTLLFNKVL